MSYSRAFSNMAANEPNEIPEPEEGVHYVRNANHIPRDSIVEWWNPNFEGDRYCYVAMEFGAMEMEVDVDAVVTSMVTLFHEDAYIVDGRMRWSLVDWRRFSDIIELAREGCIFSARMTIPAFDLTHRIPIWSFLMQYYRQMLLQGHDHVENGARIEENEEIYYLVSDDEGPEIIDLTGDDSTVDTLPLTDVSDEELEEMFEDLV